MINVEGSLARDGSRLASAQSIVLAATGKRVFSSPIPTETGNAIVSAADARRRSIAAVLALAPFAVLLGIGALPRAASAQWWENVPQHGPLNAKGEPDLTAPAPRTKDGHPDLSGIWNPHSNKYLRTSRRT